MCTNLFISGKFEDALNGIYYQRENVRLHWNLYKRCKESNKLSIKDPEEGICCYLKF